MKTATKKRARIARATCINGQSVYEVTYDGSRDMDSGVSYAYLRRLAARGFEVHVSGQCDTPDHVVSAV